MRIRNLWRYSFDIDKDPMDPIPTRPDLNVLFDLANWETDLKAYLQMMSAIHDHGRTPSTLLIKHIIDQFNDPLTGEFAAGSLGIKAPIYFGSLIRNLDA